MPIVNHSGAEGTGTWNLTTDEHHITGVVTINNVAIITITPGATPNPIRFDGNFNITSTAGGSGILTATGTAANPVRWQPNGAATTWYEDNTNRYIASDGTGGWTVSYHDFIGCLPACYPSAGTNQFDNVRVRVGRVGLANGTGFYFAPSGGTNTITDVSCYGCPGSVFGPGNAAISGGTNVVRRILVDGGTIGFNVNVSGGTNTFSDFKAVRCVTPINFSGTASCSITNFSILDCRNGISSVPGATSTITRLIVHGIPVDDVSSDIFRAAVGVGIVMTFDEAYADMGGKHGFINTSGIGTHARLVVSNSVLSGHRLPSTNARAGVYYGVSSGNDFAFPSYVDGINSAIDGGTTDNDYLASTGGMSGPTPLGVEIMQDWASVNWASVVDTDSGNVTSTSTPAQYGVIALAAGRTNARAMPNKPLTCTTPSVAMSGAAGSETATITFTTGIKARSRLLISETSGNTTRALAEIVTPWKYHGILDPELVDFTLPVTSHSHSYKPQAGKTLFVVAECYDPCGRRFLSAQQSFSTTAVAVGGGSKTSYVQGYVG